MSCTLLMESCEGFSQTVTGLGKGTLQKCDYNDRKSSDVSGLLPQKIHAPGNALAVRSSRRDPD